MLQINYGDRSILICAAPLYNKGLYCHLFTDTEHFLHEYAPGDSGEKILPFNGQKPRAEPASVVGDHLPRPGQMF